MNYVFPFLLGIICSALVINWFERKKGELSMDRVICWRCQKDCTNCFWEVAATINDIKETEFTICTSVGERIIVCHMCVTFAERRINKPTIN